MCRLVLFAERSIRWVYSFLILLSPVEILILSPSVATKLLNREAIFDTPRPFLASLAKPISIFSSLPLFRKTGFDSSYKVLQFIEAVFDRRQKFLFSFVNRLSIFRFVLRFLQADVHSLQQFLFSFDIFLSVLG